MQKGQASLEYLVIISVFLLLLAGTYSLSLNMSDRRQILQSQSEGQRTADLIARGISDAARGGDGFSYDLFVEAYPNQTFIVSGSDVIAFGPGNKSVSIATLPSWVANLSPSNFTSNSMIRINNSGGAVYVTQIS